MHYVVVGVHENFRALPIVQVVRFLVMVGGSAKQISDRLERD